MSEERFFTKNRQKIDDISMIGDKSPIYSKNRRFIPKIAWEAILSPIYGKKSPLSLQRDLMAQIKPMLIRQPNLNPNVNKEIQRPDCLQIVIQRLKLILNGNLRFQRLFWPKFSL